MFKRITRRQYQEWFDKIRRGEISLDQTNAFFKMFSDKKKIPCFMVQAFFENPKLFLGDGNTTIKCFEIDIQMPNTWKEGVEKCGCEKMGSDFAMADFVYTGTPDFDEKGSMYLVNLGKETCEEEVADRYESLGLKRTSVRGLLTFGALFPMLQVRDRPIVALTKGYASGMLTLCPMLSRKDDLRLLTTVDTKWRFSETINFLAVPKS